MMRIIKHCRVIHDDQQVMAADGGEAYCEVHHLICSHAHSKTAVNRNVDLTSSLHNDYSSACGENYFILILLDCHDYVDVTV